MIKMGHARSTGSAKLDNPVMINTNEPVLLTREPTRTPVSGIGSAS
jgi:hypothetical protein